jgi:hypothetical protein
LFDHLGGVRRNVSPVFVVEEHDVDIAEWIQLSPSISSEGDHGERRWRRAPAFLGETDGGLENVLQQDVDQLDPKGTDLTAASSVLVTEPQSMLLDLEEFFVERERFRRPHRPGGPELTLGMSEDFSEMTRRGHLHFGLDRAETFPLNPKSTI